MRGTILVSAANAAALSFLSGLVLFLISPNPTLADESSPTGLWRTTDDKTGKPRGLVRIYEEGGRLFGKVEGSLDPAKSQERCEKCTDSRKNQPMLGMVILRSMERKGDEYSGGDILDPDTGSVYKCKLKLVEGGNKLLVRGFVGFSLLGRTQVWLRDNSTARP